MHRRRFRLAERAADDLTEIYDFIADKNPQAARRMIDGIKAKIRFVADLGLTGAVRQDISSDWRVIVFRGYLIHCRVTPSHLLILRILHGRQNTSSQDFPESEI